MKREGGNDGLTNRRQHPRRDRVVEDARQVVAEPSNADGLVPQPPRGRLGDDGITRGTHGDHVAQRANYQQDPDGQLRVLPRDEVEPADDQQADEHEGQADHVDGGTAVVREEEPADDAADDVAGGEGDVDVEGLDLAEAGGLEEDDRVAEDSVAAENLGGPDDTVLLRCCR